MRLSATERAKGITKEMKKAAYDARRAKEKQESEEASRQWIEREKKYSLFHREHQALVDKWAQEGKKGTYWQETATKFAMNYMDRPDEWIEILKQEGITV